MGIKGKLFPPWRVVIFQFKVILFLILFVCVKAMLRIVWLVIKHIKNVLLAFLGHAEVVIEEDVLVKH